MPEDYPGQERDIQREDLIRKAVQAADNVICEGADGSVEELAYLTSAIAKTWAEKMHSMNTAKLLSKDLQDRN